MAETDPECNALGIPPHLHQVGRVANQEFAAEEKLYVRFKVAAAQIKTAISFRKQSCNRSLYCDGGPDDVLFDTEHGGRHEGYGVIGITVAAVRGVREVLGENSPKRVFTLRPDHQPVHCNYAHTEVVSQENAKDLPDIKPASVKKQLRDELADLYQIELPATLAGGRLERE